MKNLLFAIAFIIVSSTVFSQGKTKFGLKGGLNQATISHADFSSKSSFYFGPFLNIHLSELYELQPELVYSNQGGKMKSNNGETIEVEYLSIGVANKFFVAENSKFNIILAPSIDFDVDDTFIGLANRVEGNDATFMDIAIAVGLGYEFKNGLTIEGRYKQGLIDVYSGSFHSFESQQLENEIQFNSVFQVGISYKFNYNKNK